MHECIFLRYYTFPSFYVACAGMDNFKIVVFIMAILISLMAIANNRKLPYPILLVFAGLIIGFIPHLPELALDPDVVFVIMLPKPPGTNLKHP